MADTKSESKACHNTTDVTCDNSMDKNGKLVTVVVDGNDGTGKSTVVAQLHSRGYRVQDRGLPTKLTDNPQIEEKTETGSSEIYLILDLPVEQCQQRLLAAGKDLSEQYHTEADLKYYRQRFLDVAKSLANCKIVDASGSKRETLERAIAAIEDLLTHLD